MKRVLMPLVRPSSVPSRATSRAVVLRAEARTNPRPLSLFDRFRIHAASWTPTQRRQIAVVSRYQENAEAEVFAASYIGLELAVACTTTQNETGGPNIFQYEPASDWLARSPYGDLSGQVLTKETAAWALREEQAGAGPLVGFGMKQLTSLSLVLAANVRGGVWVAEHCAAEGDAFFLALVRETGSLWSAFYHYNGSGPAAEAYADKAIAEVAVWRSRLGTA